MVHTLIRRVISLHKQLGNLKITNLNQWFTHYVEQYSGTSLLEDTIWTQLAVLYREVSLIQR